MITVQCPDRPWCTMGAPDGEHDRFHAGDAVELAGSDGSLEAGWWSWLFENRGGPLTLTIEGHQQPTFDIPAEAAAALLVATSTPESRQRLLDALVGAGVEMPS
jgi:hypothetical protein